MSKISTPPSFHIMAKPTGAVCNLDCKYCFFLTKEALYPGSSFRMAIDTQRTYIRQYIHAQRVPEVQIAWQGGEPTLMGIEFFERAVKFARQYKKFGTRINHTIQTNGVLLDDTWCEFIHDNDFLVGLSLDGPQEIHDVFRVDKGGQPTFNRVLRAANLLKKHQVEFNILCTIHSANGDRPLDVYRFFRDEIGTRFIQFIPIVERVNTPTIQPNEVAVFRLSEEDGEIKTNTNPYYTQQGECVTDRSVKPEQYGRFLASVFDEWVRFDVGKVFVQMFDVALANWAGAAPGLCIHSETCGNALALEHNGDLYSCDHFVEPDFYLGNINAVPMADLVGSPKQRQFGKDKRETLPNYCVECPVRFACHGGCPKDRFITTPEGEKGLNYLCAGYKIFFTHIDEAMRFMAGELANKRPPANVMEYMQRKHSP
jgi:uncharacterized protein